MDGHETLDSILRGDLRQFMKERDRVSARVLRTVLTAIDNAGAVPVTEDDAPTTDFSGERARREVTNEEMYQILESQISERKEAIGVFAENGAEDRAEELRLEVQMLADYLSARPE
jgi:uncharacterized protein YqeY